MNIFALDKNELDKDTPGLTEALINQEVTDTSMGCYVESAECSVCGNIVTEEADICDHIREYKGVRGMKFSGTEDPMDVYETETDLVIIVELAGAVPENLSLSFERGILKISGRRELSADFSHTKCHQIEIDSGSFQKQIHIPFAVDKNRATSQYKDGFLKISLPKAPRTPKESIEISLE